jgi:GWxTD domain-containing protein
MSVRRTWLVALAGLVAFAAPAQADKLDKESKKWLDDVRAIILSEEVQTYGQLKDRTERMEFEKIFWARRDPDLGTPENEYQADFLTKKADADKRFRVAGKAGSATDCGRLLILFGEPDEVKKDDSGENRGPRSPETWTYKSKPGMNFTGGQAVIALDADCKFGAAGVAAQLDRVAGLLVLNPNLSYKVQGGKLTPLADLLPKPSPAQTLLKTPRQDFPLAGQSGYLKSAEGFSVLLGLARADSAHLSVHEEAGKRVVAVTVAAQVLTAEGQATAFDQRSVVAPVGADNNVVVAYRIFLKPGKYTLRYGVVDDKTGKGSANSESIDVPDLNKGELSVASVWVLADIVDHPNDADPKDALGAFVLGKSLMTPRFGNAFSKSETPMFFYNASDGAVDPTTSKPSVTIGLTLAKGTKTLAKAPDQDFDTPYVASAVGPVPLDKYEPGIYTAKLKVRDNVAKKDVTVEQTFEIKP